MNSDRANEGRFAAAVLDVMHIGVALLGGEGSFLYTNSAWNTITGNQVIGEDAEIGRNVESLLTGHAVDFVWPPEGSRTSSEPLLRFRGVPLEPNGSSVRATVLVEEVADAERFRQQIAQAQRMESVGRLASGVAHDFNNLLQAILGSVHLIKVATPADHRIRGSLDTIEQTALSAAELAGRLLTLARSRSAEPQSLNISTSIEEAVRVLRRVLLEDVQIELDLSEAAWNVYADPAQLLHILVNLGLNAQEAMEGNGTIAIRTGNMTVPNSGQGPRDLTPGDYVVLSVIDHGCGIPREIADRVFDPFFTTKPGGTGLGLSTVYSLAREQGGGVTIYSVPEMGTTINVYLQAAPEGALKASGERPVEMVAGGTETILLVDDEELLLEVGREILSLKGYHVLTASSGPEAIERHRDSPDRIPLVILDLAMPGMSGLETLRHLRETDPDLIVIISSGFQPSTEMSEQLGREVDAFVNKPYEIERLAGVVRTLLDSAKRTPAR